MSWRKRKRQSLEKLQSQPSIAERIERSERSERIVSSLMLRRSEGSRHVGCGCYCERCLGQSRTGTVVKTKTRKRTQTPLRGWICFEGRVGLCLWSRRQQQPAFPISKMMLCWLL